MTRRILLAIALSWAAGLGCASSEWQAPFNVLDARIDKEHRPTYLGLPLRSGQIIVSEAPGPYSFLFGLAPEHYFPFTHAAVLVMEDGEPFVYDMSGNYKPGFDTTPADAIVGGCRRQPFVEYCRPNLYVEIQDPPEGVDPDKVAAWVRARYEEDVEFDPYFRYDEHERLFCSELVALALVAGGAPEPVLVPGTKNPSLQMMLDWFGFARLEGVPAGLFHDPDRYVGSTGQVKTRTIAYCYLEAKREIHRRFGADQKLGNIFLMHGVADVDLRPEIIDFLNRSMALFQGARRAPDGPAITRSVRQLADEMFGPVG